MGLKNIIGLFILIPTAIAVFYILSNEDRVKVAANIWGSE